MEYLFLFLILPIAIIVLPVVAFVTLRNRIHEVLTEVKRLRSDVAGLQVQGRVQEEVQEEVQEDAQEEIPLPPHMQRKEHQSSAPHTAPSAPHTAPSAPHTAPSAPHTETEEPHTAPSAPHTETEEPLTAPSAPHTETEEPLTAPSAPHTETEEPLTVPSAPRTAPRPRRTASELEALIGGKLLNRIGAIAVLIGTLFFLKYAFENDLINEWGRVLIGVVAGGAMLFLGDRARKKGLTIFAQGLVGASIPILYLSIYASYEFYHLVPHIVAFVVMALAGALALAMALRHDSPFIAALGAIGGMLTPALLSTGEVNTTGLFTFILLLDVGLLAVALQRRRWWFIDAICAAGTVIWWAAWKVAMTDAVRDTDAQWPHGIALIFAFAFSVMWLVYDRYLVSSNTSVTRIDRVIAAVVGAASIFWTYWALSPEWEWQMDFASFGLAILFILAGLDLRKRGLSPATVSMRYTHAFAAVIVAAQVLHPDMVTTMLMSGAGLITMFLLRRDTLKTPFVSAYVVSIISCLFAARWIDKYISYQIGVLPVLNLHTGAVLITAGSFLLATIVATQRIREMNVVLLTSVLRVIFLLVAIAAVRNDVSSYSEWLAEMQAAYDGYDLVAMKAWIGRMIGVVFVAVSGFSLVFVGRWQKDNLLSWAGLATTAFASGMWLFDIAVEIPESAYAPLLNLRVASGLILIALWMLLLKTHAVDAPFKTGSWVRISAWSLGLLILALASVEAAWPFVITEDDNAIHLSLSSVWIVYGIIVMILGFMRRSRPMRIGSIILLGVSILKVFLYDLRFLEQPYRIVSFIALGVILLLASYLYQRYKHIILEGASPEP